jgi:xanthine dehydrogenase accessory factor
MTGLLLDDMIEARRTRRPYYLITLAATSGSVPRQAGGRMIVYADGTSSGTIGGGKFESLVKAEALALPRKALPLLKTWPLHEAAPDSFGAVCGGTATVLIEPRLPPPALILAGAGHCARALARLASSCDWQVTVLDDRAEELHGFPAAECLSQPAAPVWIAGKTWQEDEALVLVSRNYQLDRDALAAALRNRWMGYLGMIGSGRKVHRVVQELKASGLPDAAFTGLRAPVGLDLGADHPAEIAVSIFAEILTVFHRASGRPLSFNFSAATATASPPPHPASPP